MKGSERASLLTQIWIHFTDPWIQKSFQKNLEENRYCLILGSMKRQSPIFFMCSANWIPKSLILRINVTLVTQKIDPEICLRVFSISAFFSILCRILNKGGCYYLYLEDITTMKRAISKNDGWLFIFLNWIFEIINH